MMKERVLNRLRAENVEQVASSHQALRRWAVEQAVKWPQVMTGSNHSSGASVWNSGPNYQDADVIGRAEKLVAYVLDEREALDEVQL